MFIVTEIDHFQGGGINVMLPAKMKNKQSGIIAAAAVAAAATACSRRSRIMLGPAPLMTA